MSVLWFLFLLVVLFVMFLVAWPLSLLVAALRSLGVL